VCGDRRLKTDWSVPEWTSGSHLMIPAGLDRMVSRRHGSPSAGGQRARPGGRVQGLQRRVGCPILVRLTRAQADRSVGEETSASFCRDGVGRRDRRMPACLGPRRVPISASS
jgi:hypothetical protein